MISILHMSSINSPTEIIWTSTKSHSTSPLLYISWELRWYLKVGNKESNDFRSVWNEKAWWWKKTIKLITRKGTGGKYEGDKDGFKPMFSLKLRYYLDDQAWPMGKFRIWKNTNIQDRFSLFLGVATCRRSKLNPKTKKEAYIFDSCIR